MSSSSNNVHFYLRLKQNHVFWTHQRSSGAETLKLIRSWWGQQRIQPRNSCIEDFLEGRGSQEKSNRDLYWAAKRLNQKITELRSTQPAQSVLKGNARRGEQKNIWPRSCVFGPLRGNIWKFHMYVRITGRMKSGFNLFCFPTKFYWRH